MTQFMDSPYRVPEAGQLGLGQVELHQLVLVQQRRRVGVESSHGEEEQRPHRHPRLAGLGQDDFNVMTLILSSEITRTLTCHLVH